MRYTKFLLLIVIILASASAAHEGDPYPESLHKIIDYNNQLAASITFLVAFLAGIVAFTSPCGFVLLPAFFSFWFKERKKAVAMTAAFSAGLTLAFASLGIIAAVFGNVFAPFRTTFAAIGGAILILFGILAFMNKGFTLFQFKLDHQPKDWLGVILLGFFFGIGWTPCISPILSGMFILAANKTTMLQSILLMSTFALGVSTPLLILSYISDKKDWANANWLKGKHITLKLFGKQIHTHTYNLISGTLLIILGAAMLITKGTSIIEQQIYKIWSMKLYNTLNTALVSGPLSTTFGNIIGISLAIIIIAVIIWQIKSKHGNKKEI